MIWFMRYHTWIWCDTRHGLWHDTCEMWFALYEILLCKWWYMCDTWYWKWYVMVLVLRTMIYEYCTCLTWLKRKGNWLDVLILAWIMFTEGGLCDVQDRPAWVTSGIHVSIMFYMITEGGLCGIRNKFVWATSGIHTSILVGGLYDVQDRPVWVTSGIHASICLASSTWYFDLRVHISVRNPGAVLH